MISRYVIKVMRDVKGEIGFLWSSQTKARSMLNLNLANHPKLTVLKSLLANNSNNLHLHFDEVDPKPHRIIKSAATFNWIAIHQCTMITCVQLVKYQYKTIRTLKFSIPVIAQFANTKTLNLLKSNQ
jgi:hypothetical protein